VCPDLVCRKFTFQPTNLQYSKSSIWIFITIARHDKFPIEISTKLRFIVRQPVTDSIQILNVVCRLQIIKLSDRSGLSQVSSLTKDKLWNSNPVEGKTISSVNLNSTSICNGATVPNQPVQTSKELRYLFHPASLLTPAQTLHEEAIQNYFFLKAIHINPHGT
jgi:hypothetical protein